MKNISITDKLAGKYRNKVKKTNLNIEEMKLLYMEENKNIDFVDALICAKSKLQGFGKLSFDSDVEKC